MRERLRGQAQGRRGGRGDVRRPVLLLNVNATAGITSVSQLASMTTTQVASSGNGQSKDNRRNKNGWGYGYCDCDGGLKSLRLVNKGTEPASISLEGKNGEAMCSFDAVVLGDENMCEVPAGTSKFSMDTTVTLTTATETCEDTIHTSFVVSGWQNNNSAGDCDDGFEPCDCETVGLTCTTEWRPRGGQRRGGGHGGNGVDPVCDVSAHSLRSLLFFCVCDESSSNLVV